jgi:hypothetical protein
VLALALESTDLDAAPVTLAIDASIRTVSGAQS